MTSSEIIFLLSAAILAFPLYIFLRILPFAMASAGLVVAAKAFTRDSGMRSLLVLGDSTAVGVGSPSELSVPGRLGEMLQASVENHAVSGAKTHHLALQLANVKRKHYDMVLIHIGANDVLYFSNLSRVIQTMDERLREVRELSDRVIVLTAGDIGDAPILPWPLNTVMSMRTRRLRRGFMEVTKERGVVYVDLYSRLAPFKSAPDKYYAPDKLHLTGDGYGFWFSVVKEYVHKNWPELS